MKKLLFIGFILIGFASGTLAQENVVKINIFSPIVKTVSVFYERQLTDNTSGQLGFFYTGYKVTDTKFTGFGITPEWRYYFDETFRGFYLGPFARYQSFTLTNSYEFSDVEDEATLSTIGAGVLIGRQWLFNDWFSLDTFIGPSFNSGKVKVKSEGTEEDTFSTGAFDGFGVRVGVTLGAAF